MTPQTWTFPSSSGGKDHTTTLVADGTLTCSCPGWCMKKPNKPRMCKKHMERLIAENGWTVEVVGDLIRVSTEVTAGAWTAPPTGTAIAGDVAALVALAAVQNAQLRAPMMASGMTTRLEGDAFDKAYAGWLADLKVDGHRRMVEKNGDVLRSWSYPRDGEPPAIVPLPANIEACFRRMPDGWYDGEYSAVGMDAKSWDASRTDLEKQFYVFDVLSFLGTDVTAEPLTNRRQLIEAACAKAQCAAVQPVPRFEPTWASYEGVRAKGGEGLVLKRPESPYMVGTRSGYWVKLKALEQHVVTITGFMAGSFGPHATILAKFDDGVPVKFKTRNNDWLRRFAEGEGKGPGGRNAYIGQRMTMECQLRTKDGSARHPMAKELVIDHLTAGSE